MDCVFGNCVFGTVLSNWRSVGSTYVQFYQNTKTRHLHDSMTQPMKCCSLVDQLYGRSALEESTFTTECASDLYKQHVLDESMY